MHLYHVVLLAAATLLASLEALPSSGQAKGLDATSLEASQWAPSFAKENGDPAGCSYRKREADEEDDEGGDEERALGLERVPSVLESVPSLSEKSPPQIKRFNNKFGRLSQYNAWFLKARSPEWVKENFPKFFDSYKKFWENRMVRRGKYNLRGITNAFTTGFENNSARRQFMCTTVYSRHKPLLQLIQFKTKREIAFQELAYVAFTLLVILFNLGRIWFDPDLDAFLLRPRKAEPPRSIFKRKTTTHADDEQITFDGASVAKKFGSKLKILVKHNAWILLRVKSPSMSRNSITTTKGARFLLQENDVIRNIRLIAYKYRGFSLRDGHRYRFLYRQQNVVLSE